MKVLKECARAELVVKNSRFIAELFIVTSQSQAREKLHELKQKYFDARHVVHAFVTGKNAEVSGMSDDGEPSGTAGRPVLDVLKGSGIAVSITLILILLFAVIIKLTNIPDNFIMPINQFIKILSIFLGCYLTLKKVQQKGLVTGILIGLVYTALAYLIFSILGNTFSLDASLFIDMGFAMLIGGLCGIFAVNKKIRN